jgi:hypothetical protein
MHLMTQPGQLPHVPPDLFLMPFDIGLASRPLGRRRMLPAIEPHPLIRRVACHARHTCPGSRAKGLLTFTTY